MDIFPSSGTGTPEELANQSWLERQFANASMILLLGAPFVFPILFPIVLVLSGIAMFTLPPGKGKSKASTTFIVLSCFFTLFLIIATVAVLNS